MGKEPDALRYSVLDRLVADDHESARPGFSQVRRWVIRDLENLLNTRRRILEPPDAYPEIQKSFYRYGLPDFSARNPKSPFARVRLQQEVEETIRLFEPRLQNVAVRVEDQDGLRGRLKFRISAVLVVDPYEEPVMFHTVIDLNRGEAKVSG